MRIFAATSLALLLLFLSTVARSADFGPQSKISLTTLTDASSLPAGATGTLAIQVDIAPNWHIQSAQPHDPFSIPALLTLTPNPGIHLSPVQYPQHQELPNPDLLTPNAPATVAVYEDHLVILVDFQVNQTTKPGPVTLSGILQTQACTNGPTGQCLPPVRTPVETRFTITPAGSAPVPQNQALFAAARAQKFLAPSTAPAPPPTTVPTATLNSTAPGKDVVLVTDEEQIKKIGERGYKPYNEDHPTLLWIILSALLGGAILNVMPCVLPVIPLKVLGLVQQAHGDRRLAILHGLTFSAGIISLFVALAVTLKIAGLFYGQQFQNAWFLIAMAYIVLALALSMLGVWTIQTPQAVYKIDQPHSGFLGSYSSGLLATLLATPCSAPYLGPVLGWALLQPAWITALALALVGVGMAAPYLILAAFPGLLAKMPKAGRWTELLKQGLGIIMIGVGVYLLLLLPNSTMWPFVIYGAVLLGLVCWAWGQIPTGAMEPSTVWTIRGIALALGLSAGLGIYLWGANTLRAENSNPTIASAQTVRLPDAFSPTWLPFNTALLDQALADGRPVVVDWGANWCINCRVLEAQVLHAKEVQKAFAAHNAVLLRADETVENPPTTFLNNKLGGQSIPVLAIFSPAHSNMPIVLRDNYTQHRVITELQNSSPIQNQSTPKNP